MTAALVFLRLAAGAVFMVSGYFKLVQPNEHFVAALLSYEVVSGAPAQWIAQAFPWFELLAGSFLFSGLWQKAARPLLWAANTVFIAVLAQALLRGLPLEDCGCFGESLSLPPKMMLAVDAALWLVFLVLSWKKDRAGRFSLDALFGNAP